MKKLLSILVLVVISFTLMAQTSGKDTYRESTVKTLRKDAVMKFFHEYEVKNTATFDTEKDLWKVVIEDVMPPAKSDSRNVWVLWLKLDEGCKPDGTLNNFKISGYTLGIELVKK